VEQINGVPLLLCHSVACNENVLILFPSFLSLLVVSLLAWRNSCAWGIVFPENDARMARVAWMPLKSQSWRDIASPSLRGHFMSESEIQFDVKKMRTEEFENSEIEASFVDSASSSDAPDKVLSAFNASFPEGYFDCLFQEGEAYAR